MGKSGRMVLFTLIEWLETIYVQTVLDCTKHLSALFFTDPVLVHRMLGFNAMKASNICN